jgi:hypothetical protein
MPGQQGVMYTARLLAHRSVGPVRCSSRRPPGVVCAARSSSAIVRRAISFGSPTTSGNA